MRRILFVVGVFGLPVVVSVSQHTISAAVIQEADPRLQRLQEFFEERDCPLREAAADFLAAADKNALDWRLLPSISIIESSGGKDYKRNNVFGWDSGRESFASVEEGIHFVAAQLATSRRYRDKGLDEKLNTYNPVPGYTQRVKAVMRTMGSVLN